MEFNKLINTINDLDLKITNLNNRITYLEDKLTEFLEINK